jgi:methionine synthase II (cobalamin-independent)
METTNTTTINLIQVNENAKTFRNQIEEEIDNKYNDLTNEKSLINRYQKLLPNYLLTYSDAKYSKRIKLIHETVPYIFHNTTNIKSEPDSMEKNLNKNISHSLNKFNLVINEYHYLVKEIYDLCVSLYNEDILVMPGGGSQLQVFFLNSKGYIGILYPNKKGKHQFVSEGKENDIYFVGKFNIKKTKFISHKELYGKDEENIKEPKNTTNIEVTNPVEVINQVISEYGDSELFNNPLSILIHMFYTFGNEYELMQNNGISFISRDKPSISRLEEIEKNRKANFFYNMFISLENTNYDGKKLDVKDIEEIGKLFAKLYKEKTEEIQKLQLKNIEDLENIDIDTNNPFFKNINNITSKEYSIINKNLSNLSKDWKRTIEILEKKLTSHIS